MVCLYLIEGGGGRLCGGDHRSYCGEGIRENLPSADLRVAMVIVKFAFLPEKVVT